MNKEKNGAGSLRVLGRLMKYLFRYYKGYFAVIMLCIVITAAAGVSSSVFLEILVDEVIAPGITQGFGAVSAMLTKIILVMGGIYVLKSKRGAEKVTALPYDEREIIELWEAC